MDDLEFSLAVDQCILSTGYCLNKFGARVQFSALVSILLDIINSESQDAITTKKKLIKYLNKHVIKK